MSVQKYNIKNTIYEKYKMCYYEGCNKKPIYAGVGKVTPLFCKDHKLENMVVIHNNRCLEEHCINQAIYNFSGQNKGVYCKEHSLLGMTNVKYKTCKTYLCSTIVSKKYDGYCLFCYINMFPDKPVLRNYKTKEYSVVEYVKNTFQDLSWISDKKINDGCSKRRPDLLLDLGYQVLIIEVDENQHIEYNCSCENKRIMELSQDVGHRPIVFIRFNPDKYLIGTNTIKSCWGINSKGISIIKKNKKKEWNKRLETLKKQIEYWIHPDNYTNKTVEIIQLFYNN
jgi:hypothetical protein